MDRVLTSIVFQAVVVCYVALYLIVDVTLPFPVWLRFALGTLPIAMALKTHALLFAPGGPIADRSIERFFPVHPGPSESWFERMRSDPYGLARASVLFALPPGLAGRPCAVCKDALHAPAAVCKACETAAHEACWRFAAGCPRYGCEPRDGEPVKKLRS